MIPTLKLWYHVTQTADCGKSQSEVQCEVSFRICTQERENGHEPNCFRVLEMARVSLHRAWADSCSRLTFTGHSPVNRGKMDAGPGLSCGNPRLKPKDNYHAIVFAVPRKAKLVCSNQVSARCDDEEEELLAACTWEESTGRKF